MKSFPGLLLFFILILSSCQKAGYNVPDEFDVYVKRFEYEGTLRSVNVSIQDKGLKVEFADFTGEPYVDLCNYENPVRIQLIKNIGINPLMCGEKRLCFMNWDTAFWISGATGTTPCLTGSEKA